MRQQHDDDYFVIDLDQLVEQWSVFARDYLRKARALVDAKAEFERMKRVRDVVEAELDRDIRRDPEAFGLEHRTEKAIEKTIILQKSYQDAEEELIKAKHAMDIHQVEIDAMDAMKKALESSTYLFQSAYYAEPQVRGDAGSRMADARMHRNLARRRSEK